MPIANLEHEDEQLIVIDPEEQKIVRCLIDQEVVVDGVGCGRSTLRPHALDSSFLLHAALLACASHIATLPSARCCISPPRFASPLLLHDEVIPTTRCTVSYRLHLPPPPAPRIHSSDVVFPRLLALLSSLRRVCPRLPL